MPVRAHPDGQAPAASRPTLRFRFQSQYQVALRGDMGAGPTGAAADPHDGTGTRSPRRMPSRERVYRVEYQAATGDGHIVVGAEEAAVTSGLVGYAHDLLAEQGIEARIRRIVPGRRAAG